jgi:hypothetical protein
MNMMQKALRAVALGVAYLTVSAGAAGAQAWVYPSFQQPQTTGREYNFALADGDFGGTSLLFQWREGYGTSGQFSMDVGYADMDPSDGLFYLGGQYGHQLIRAGAEGPIDLMLTVGGNAGFGDGYRIFRVPVGASIGHRFPLENGLAITPYVHPRASIDIISIPDQTINGFRIEGQSDSDVNVNFDMGGSFEFSRALALRLSATLGDDDAVGLSLAFTPGGHSVAGPTRTPRPARSSRAR